MTHTSSVQMNDLNENWFSRKVDAIHLSVYIGTQFDSVQSAENSTLYSIALCIFESMSAELQ